MKIAILCASGKVGKEISKEALKKFRASMFCTQ